MKRNIIVTPICEIEASHISEPDKTVNKKGVYWIKPKIKPYKDLKSTIEGLLFELQGKLGIKPKKPYRITDDYMTMIVKSADKPIVTDLNNKPYYDDITGLKIQVALEFKEYSDSNIGTGLSPRIVAILVHAEQEEISL